MFPPTIEHPDIYIARGKSAVKMTRKKWDPSYQLISVQPPMVLNHEKDSQKTYPRRKYASIRFKYKNQKGQMKWKTILFGDIDGQYVGTKNQQRRILRFTRLSNQQDPFHPNYWRLQILNTQPTLEEAYIKFMRRVMQIKPIPTKNTPSGKPKQYYFKRKKT